MGSPEVVISEMNYNPLASMTPVTDCEPEESIGSGLNGLHWRHNDDDPADTTRQSRNPNPRYVFLTEIEKLEKVAHDFEIYDAKLNQAIKDPEKRNS